MNEAADFWYVRLPDGRIFRAASTLVVRQEVTSGRIPPGSSVRRNPQEEWVALEWTREFADLIEQSAINGSAPAMMARATERGATRATTVADRLDPQRMQTIGVGALAQELLATLDSTILPRKLTVAAVTGLAFGVLATVVQTSAIDFGARWANVGALAVALLLGVCVPMGILTRMTYLELSRLRQARWKHGLRGLAPLVVRLMIGLGLVAGVGTALIVLVRWLPIWALPEGDASLAWLREAAAGSLLAAGMAVEVALYAVLGVGALLAPLMVVEQCSVGRALVQWVVLLRQHLGRVFLFEALVLGAGLAMPFAALLVPLTGMFVEPRLALAAVCARNLLAGLVGGLLLAYVLVANVFVYLNIRYSGAARR